MGYKVIHFFNDLQDLNYAYHVGDEFPRMGVKVSETRIRELSSDNNKQGKPLIEFVGKKSEVKIEEVTEDTATVFTKTEINRMPLNELKALASANGIDGWMEMTGADLKKKLIKKFNL